MKLFVLLVALLPVLTSLRAQEAQHLEGDLDERFHISVLGGVAFVSKGTDEKGNDISVMTPVIGLEFEYELSHRWAVALMTDLELKEYQVDIDNRPLPRDNLWITTLVGMYKITERLMIYAGPGVEIDPNEDFFVVRTGLKYEFKIGNGYDITPTLEFDWKEKYVSQFFGLSVGKRF